MNQKLICTYLLICWCTQFVTPLNIVDDFINITFNVTSFTFCQSVNQQFQIYMDFDINQCVTECGLREHCQSLNYNNEMRLCQLFLYKEEVSSSRHGCIYVEKRNIQVIKDPCGQNCSYGTTCDQETRACVIKECVEDLVNITMVGNKRAVGSVIRWFTQNGVNVRSTCLSFGNWSYEFNSPNVVCIQLFGCHKTYINRNLAGSDLAMNLVNSLNECLAFCATTEYKTCIHSDTNSAYGANCFCKSMSVQEYTSWYGGLPYFANWILYEKMIPISEP